MTCIPLFRSNFNAPVIFYKWKTVSWEDFAGFVKPFTRWGAGISSNVYVEFDSLKQRYIAYAAMNNQLSWKKSSSVTSSYLLNHEQYHFNLTEYLARKLNNMIEEEELINEEEILLKLSSIRTELSRLQDDYDTESNHSLNRGLQRQWEFRIDSLLKSFEGDSGHVIDYYSGGFVMMPSDYEFYRGVHENESSYRLFQMKKYDMTLAMTSFQYMSLSLDAMEENIDEYYVNDSLEVVQFNVDSSIYDYEVNVEAYDSTEQKTIFHLWVHHDDYLYKLTARFPYDSLKNSYRNIAKSFINSFKIVDTKEYWLGNYRSLESNVNISKATPLTSDNKAGEGRHSKCATFGEQKQYGFYGKPIFTEDSTLILPFNIVEHADSLVYEVGALHNKEWYSYEKEPEDQMFFISKKKLSNANSFKFGYLLKQDSIKKCYTFYYQSIEVGRSVTKELLEESPAI